jgi:hypothetical protein
MNRTVVAVLVVVVTVTRYQESGYAVIVPEVFVKVPTLSTVVKTPVAKLNIALPLFVLLPLSRASVKAVTLLFTHILALYVRAVASFV